MSYILIGGLPTVAKDPDASLRYGIDVADVLHPSDTIASVAVTGTGITVTAASHSGTIISARVAGGTAGTTHALQFAWTTAGGDTDHRTVYLAVAER
jgi:hypothetical protein